MARRSADTLVKRRVPAACTLSCSWYVRRRCGSRLREATVRIEEAASQAKEEAGVLSLWRFSMRDIACVGMLEKRKGGEKETNRDEN